MKCNVTVPAELGGEERRLWASFCEDSCLDSPFLSWQFADAVGRIRGDSRVAVLEDGGEVLGFLPFQSDARGEGSPLGASISDAQAFVAPRPWTFDAPGLVTQAGLASWSFDHLIVEQEPFVPFHRYRHRSPVVDLTGGYDEFIQRLRRHSKDFLPQVLRRRRKLERDIGPVHLEWRSTAFSSDMARLQQWKSDQYRRTEVWDRFSRPWIVETIHALAEVQDEPCTGILSALRSGDQLAAVHFGLASKSRLCWWFPAYEPELGRYSPGLIMLLELISAAAERGVAVLDLGRGEHDYKFRVADRFYEVDEGALITNERGGRH
jgi:CelD/BcsL family acetyltransferase involved in cellulose biosynthesis